MVLRINLWSTKFLNIDYYSFFTKQNNYSYKTIVLSQTIIVIKHIFVDNYYPSELTK